MVGLRRHERARAQAIGHQHRSVEDREHVVVQGRVLSVPAAAEASAHSFEDGRRQQLVGGPAGRTGQPPVDRPGVQAEAQEQQEAERQPVAPRRLGSIHRTRDASTVHRAPLGGSATRGARLSPIRSSATIPGRAGAIQRDLPRGRRSSAVEQLIRNQQVVGSIPTAGSRTGTIDRG